MNIWFIKVWIIKYFTKLWSAANWEGIKRFGWSPAFSSIFLFPFVTAIIQMHHLEAKIPFLALSVSLSSSAALKIYLLYFGLFFLFIGSALYSAFCPEFIKRFENSMEFIKSDMHVHRNRGAAIELLKFTDRRLIEHGKCISTVYPDSLRRLNISVCHIKSILNDKLPIDEDSAAEWMLAHWHFMMKSMPLRRFIIFSNYMIGIAMISLLSIIGVLQTMYAIFR